MCALCLIPPYSDATGRNIITLSFVVIGHVGPIQWVIVYPH